MPSRKHGRQYDVVVLGATGYTGKFTAEMVATHLPTDFKWAVAGRSRQKLEQVVSKCKSLNPDRRQPEIEVCNLDDSELKQLAKKTAVLLTTIGPYGRYGEHAFKACAENGTHYADVTGEFAFVAKMIKKYEAVAKATGAIMFPQCAIESAPPDLLTWAMASTLRSKLSTPVRDVTVSIHKLSSAPSGGTLASAFDFLDNFSRDEVHAFAKPFALSPVPNPNARRRPTALLSRLTGLVTYPTLGLQTTSIAFRTDATIVQRTWGLLQTIPSRKSQSYGAGFNFYEFMKPRNWLRGILIHYGLFLLYLIMAVRPLKVLVKRFVFQPGEGTDPEEATKDQVEYRGIATPDVDGPVTEMAFARCWFNGSVYHLSGLLIAQAACTILEDDLQLDGGIYTPACLGQSYIDRLESVGFHFESKIIPA